MLRRRVFVFTCLILSLVLASCASQPAAQPPPTTRPTDVPTEAAPTPAGSKIANPASEYCIQNGGSLEIRTDSQGGQLGYCIFPDASECEEWAYFRGECSPGDSLKDDQPVADAIPNGWKLYINEDLGYSFLYPADAAIQSADDPLKSLSIQGPQVNGDSWPSIAISHPADREEYQIPEGAVLADWLVEHNLVPAGAGDPSAETRLDDIQIAGETAVHLRHDRSQQSYAYDRYYFAHNGQLYMIVIGHTADKEDWDLYNQFLGSFTFDQ